MFQLLRFFIVAALFPCGKCRNTRVVIIDEIPIVIAGTPAPTNGIHGILESYTPTLEFKLEDNVTVTAKDAEQSNMTNVTPTDENDQTPPTTPMGIHTLKPKYIMCDNDTDCEIHKFERCRKFRSGHVGKCMCIPGHSWTRGGTACEAVKYYEVVILTMIEYQAEFDDRSTSEFRYLEYQAREGIYDALMASNLKSILVGAKSYCGFQNSTSGHVILSFRIKLSRSYAPEEDEVRREIIEGIKSVLQNKGTREFTTLSDTMVLIDKSTLPSLQVTAPNPCSSGYMNYCDHNAECMPSTRSFSCQCKDGYTDVSFNKLETPGERCKLKCECSEHGNCVYTEKKGVYCQCNGWYLGSTCSINGELLLIGISAIIGGLLILGIICCCCCIYRMKHSMSESDDCTSMTTLDKHQTNSTGKTPHSWVNTWRYYSFSPTYPMSNPYSTWTRPHSNQRRSSRHNRIEPYPGTVMMYPSELSIPRPQVTPVGYSSSFYY